MGGPPYPPRTFAQAGPYAGRQRRPESGDDAPERAAERRSR